MEEQNKTKLKPKGADIASLVTVCLILLTFFITVILLFTSNNEDVYFMAFSILFLFSIPKIVFFMGLFICINLVLKKEKKPSWIWMSSLVLLIIYLAIFVSWTLYRIINFFG